jgi:putative heme-binding domain-containing protein
MQICHDYVTFLGVSGRWPPARTPVVGEFLMRGQWHWWFIVAALPIGAAPLPALVAQDRDKPLTKPQGDPAKAGRPTVKKWKVEDFEPLLENGLTGRSFDRGKRIFKEATCALCHTFGDEGGTVGPVLTESAGRFGALDVLLHTIEPSKAIPDAYASIVVEVDDGRILVGTVQEFEGYVEIVTDLFNPDRKVTVDREKIVSMKKSPVSPMPPNLIDTFQADEILDLVAFLLSRGDPKHEMFTPLKKKK